MNRGVGTKGGKKKGATFVIDFGKPVEDKIMEIASLDKFLHERIKVGGKVGNLGDSVTISREKNKISVTSDDNFSERPSSCESNARTYVNVDNDDYSSQTERPRLMGQNAARRAGFSSTMAASTDSVAVLVSNLSAVATSNNLILDALNKSQRSIDFQFYLAPHKHLSGTHLELTLREKERICQKYGWRVFWNS
ncbi:hypothetical protein OSB04_022830 [Centaurea solstitialis]|uniref:Large ribosomal subunit protein eL22 n=1 Tax=Centaurea solstitialis TaxID=347529 RepID=A0AA38SQH7_9ASTR|nr:hypothetical protein OSB04_022830 [Centaurea solstitialis]